MITEVNSFNRENKLAISKAIAALFNQSDFIPFYIQDMTIKRLIWACTEHDNNGVYRKYDGQPLWSEGALAQRLKNIQDKRPLNADLRHEHCVPRKIILEKIYSLKFKNVDAIFEILDKFCHAVIVSKDEDKLLNKYRSKMQPILTDERTVQNLFARYINSSIEVNDVGGRDLTKSDFELGLD